jgi:hypothetical protein
MPYYVSTVTELARNGKFALTIEPHWYSGHGRVANAWRYTVTVDTEYGPSQLASCHYSRSEDSEAYRVTVDRGLAEYGRQLERFGVFSDPGIRVTDG